MKTTFLSLSSFIMFMAVIAIWKTDRTGIVRGRNEISNKFFTGQTGVIYNKNTWTTTTDFIPNGNATATLSGNYVNISSATQDDWNNIVYITDYQTKLEKWKFRLRFKIMTWSGSSYGIGFGLKSANAYVQNDVMGFIQTTTSGTGGLYILKSGRTIMQAGATPLGVNLNDVIEMEGTFYDSVFHFTAHNITTGSMANTSFTYASNGTTHVVPNTSRFALMELGGTHQVQHIEISSEEITGANIVTIGDSKTIGYFSNTFTGRYAAQLRNNYSPVVISAGGADRVTNVLDRKDEIVQLAGSKYLLSIGSNDLRFGSTLAALQVNYDSLVRTLQATGAQVYHIVLPEDHTKPLGVNLLAFKDWVAATYPAFYINVWDSISTGNVLKGIYDTGDGVHLNQQANDKIYQAIVASNKLGSGATLPVKLLSFDARQPDKSKVAVNWRVDENMQAAEYILMRSNDGFTFGEIYRQMAYAGSDYHFTDEKPFAGINYYRLKMKEADGMYSYSKVVLIRSDDRQGPVITLGKVSGNNFQFRISSHNTVNYGWQVLDASGRVVVSGRKTFTGGDDYLPVEMSRFLKGVYYLVLEADGKTPQTGFAFVR